MRRVALPDAFFTLDGLFQTFITVLDGFTAFPAVIAAELRRELPFLTTTRVLMAAVRAGVGREVAHDAIKGHAVDAALARRRGDSGDLRARLAGDDRLPLDADQIDALLGDPLALVGDAPRQVRSFVASVADVVAGDPAAAAYDPAPIL